MKHPKPRNPTEGTPGSGLPMRIRYLRSMLHKANPTLCTPPPSIANGKNRLNQKSRVACLALLLASCVSSPGLAIAETMEEQLRLQEELLSQLGDEPAMDPTKPVRAPNTAPESRTAPRAPIDRDYPPAIFDESEVVISPGEWGNQGRRRMILRVLDADRDNQPEIQRWIDPESKLLIRQAEDRNYDGVVDTWSQYEWGGLVSRILDNNDDGNPDAWERYDKGRMTAREVDRNEDGIRDAFYTYVGESLVEEKHDANNDGRSDLVIVYEKRRRIRSEEDTDHDGRVDTRTFFTAGQGPEIALRIERHTKGRGEPDVVEFFETGTGSAVIGRREEDVDGDGDVDIISVFDRGKLVRREIYDPAVTVTK